MEMSDILLVFLQDWRQRSIVLLNFCIPISNGDWPKCSLCHWRVRRNSKILLGWNIDKLCEL